MTPINPQMRAGEWGLLFALALIWGFSFFFIGVSVKAIPPFSVVVLRVGFAALALLGVMLASGQGFALTGKAAAVLILLGFLNNAFPFSLIVWGQTHISSGLASILNAITPMFTLIVAHFLTHDEKMTRQRVVGLLVGFAGIVIMIGTDALKGLGGHVLGQLAVCVAAFSYALGGVSGRRFQGLGLTPLQLSAGTMTAATLMLVPLVLVVDRPWNLPVPGWHVWGAILGLSLMCTALAYIIYFRILATAGAVNIMLVTFMVPVTAIMLGAVFLDEQLAPKHFAGMGLIGLGLLAIDGRLVDWLRSRTGTTASEEAS